MDTIKFGTDGWRAIIAQEYTVANVARVATALAIWLKQKSNNPKVVLGHDCRFGGELFAETTAKVLCANGIQVVLAKNFVSTPMVSFGVKELKAQQGVVITASHNPPAYNGFKLKGSHGGPTPPIDIAEVEALIPDTALIPSENIAYYEQAGMLQYVALEDIYCQYLQSKFNLEALNHTPAKIAYDAMFGAGQNVIRRLLPSTVLLHCEENPSFKGTPPEPIHKNLLALSKTLANAPELKVGLATDGDADRIGLYDEDGHFVDAHHIILLLINYLHQYKKLKGKVVVAFSVTNRVKKMCTLFNIPIEITKIGFKYISEKMVKEDVLLGGEESGGIAVKGHIPERDGIYDGLIIYEYMMETGKTLKELCSEIHDIVGAFHYERNDLTLPDAQKIKIISNAENGIYQSFGDFKIESVETIDGVKYNLENGGWVMLRASGTEPLLRIYVEGNSKQEAEAILKAVKKEIL